MLRTWRTARRWLGGLALAACQGAFGAECRSTSISGLEPISIDPKEALEAGRRAAQGGRNREAVRFLEYVPSLRSGEGVQTAVAKAWLALAYARIGERELGMKAAAEALALEPGLPAAVRYEIRVSLAPVFARYHGRAGALVHAREAVETAPSSLARGIALANVARLETDALAAAEAARRALESLGHGDTVHDRRLARLAALEVLAATSGARDRDVIEATIRAALGEADRASDPASAADALGLLAMVRSRAGDLEAAHAAADRAVRLAGATDGARLHDWLWLRAQLRARLGKPHAAIEDYAAATDRLRRVRLGVEGDLADFGQVFRERYGVLYLQYADLLLTRAEDERDVARGQALLSDARDAIEISKVAEVAEYFRDPCISREGIRTRLEGVDPGAAILYYVAFPDRVVALVSHRDGMEQRRLPSTAAELSSLVDDFRRLLEKRSTRQYVRPSRKLYALLLEPLEPLLASKGARTLVIVPDGPLRTIPFAALHDGSDFIARRFAIAIAPSLSLTDPRPFAEARPEALVNGLTVARHGFSSLPEVHAEVAALRTILPTRVALDQDFVSTRILQDVERSHAAIVHIASHGQFSSRAEDTFLLAYDGKLDIDRLRAAIAAGRTRPEPIEILGLSACQTAAGDERAALGLAGVAVRAGARSALATLWNVNDESTAMLVAEFYRNAVTRRLPRAESLRRAQVSLIEDDRFGHPAYWSAFLLIGSWL